MRRFFQQVSLTFFAPALVVLGIFACNQVDTPKANTFPCSMPTPNRPHMWVDYKKSQATEKDFFGNAGFLTLIIQKPETDSFYYPAAVFNGMIDYFGGLSGIKYVDVYPVVDTSGTLNFLYQPVDGKNPPKYYRLSENATSFDETATNVAPTLADAWKANYANTVEKYLNPTLDTTDPGNYLDCAYAGNPQYLLNTVHVAYFYSYLQELETEISYQACAHHDTITGFKVFFSVQPRQPKGGKLAYSNRLFPQFEFTRDVNGLHQEFYVDTTDGFGSRPIQTPVWPGTTNPACPIPSVRKADTMKGNDNGQLCPPTCNP